ncbi:MAG: M42 family metallopeptidase [Anaerolineae bacterium]|nr:M42 family metallopeptidase [Anaerolineae bacterium]
MKTLLKILTECASPTGRELPIRNLIRSMVESLADEVSVDVMGNLIARKGSLQPGGMKIMLSAHIDEIGIAVTHVDDNGFVRFTNVGGVRPYTCYSGRVRFSDGTVGVIGMEPTTSVTEVQPLSKMYIDVGATNPADCPVSVGDFGVFDRPFAELGNGRIVSKAMDDRAGAAVLVRLLEMMPENPHEIYFVFSTQEEVGLRGARTAAYHIDPDLGIALDVTLTGDTPKSATMDVALGKGPAIKVKDSGMISSPALVRYLTEIAVKEEIPYQMEVLTGGTTDAAAIQVSRGGVPSGCISIPCRYVHSPSEVVDLADMENAVRLLVAALGQSILLGDA